MAPLHHHRLPRPLQLRLPLLLLPLLVLLPAALSAPLRLTLQAPSPPAPPIERATLALPTAPVPALPLSGTVSICPADFPRGFALLCPTTARSATFFVDSVRVKTSSRTWFLPHVMSGYFRGNEIMWEGFAHGSTVKCVSNQHPVAQASIRLAC